MEFEWQVTPAGNWRLFDRSEGYAGPMAIALAHRTAGTSDMFAGIIFNTQGFSTDDETHDVVFRAEYPLEEMKALIETTITLRGRGSGI